MIEHFISWCWRHVVRMILPPIAHRRVTDRELSDFFHTHRKPMFNRAISRLCRFYNVRRPRISWFEYLDWGKTAGKTYHDGRIHLVHPENWKRGRVYNTERMWVQMIYHEMAHYLFWTDTESKADLFMRRMVSRLRQCAARSCPGAPGCPTAAATGARDHQKSRVGASTPHALGVRLGPRALGPQGNGEQAER